MALNPQDTYVHLSAEGKATELPGGDAFWSLPQSEIERYGHGWVVSEYEFTADWQHWEMHPNADEFVYLLSGSVDLLLEKPEGKQHHSLRTSGAFVVPRGVWHTARVHEPSRLLHVTLGSGTQHRSL